MFLLSSTSSVAYPVDRLGECLKEGFADIRVNYSIELIYHQVPVFPIDAQGSCGASGAPACRNSIEIPSGVRMKAM